MSDVLRIVRIRLALQQCKNMETLLMIFMSAFSGSLQGDDLFQHFEKTRILRVKPYAHTQVFRHLIIGDRPDDHTLLQ